MTSLKVIVGVPQLAPAADAVALPVTFGPGTPDVGQAENVAGQEIDGGVLQVWFTQLTVIVNESVFTFPQLSTAVYVTVVDPAENKLPG